MMDMSDLDWQVGARCRGLWDIFIDDVDDNARRPSAEVEAICSSCPVKTECLDYALERKPSGVWGGTTEYQRRQLLAGKERVFCPGCGSSEVFDHGDSEICLACGISWRI